MQVEGANEAQMRAARQLALHLRQNPEDARRPPGELAEEFGLPATFVANVLSGIQAPVRKEGPGFPKVDLSFVVRAYRFGARVWDRVTRNPVLFVIVTAIICGLIVAISSTSGRININRRGISSDGIIPVTAFTVTFVLHMACYYKRRMARYAMLGALALWLGLSFLIMITSWLEMRQSPEGIKAGLLLLAAFGMFVICLFYSAIGSAAAVLGAYFDLRRQARREDRMSRQDLLEHYFELQERLDASEGLAPRQSIFDSDFAKALFNTGPLWALLTGLVLNTLLVIVMLASKIDFATQASQINWVTFANLILGLIAFLSYVAAGFFARNVWWAMVSSLFISIGGIPPILIGMHVFNMRYLESDFSVVPFVISTCGYIIVSLFGALGGIVQRRAAREMNLAQNDPASILAEMVRIQWRLSDRTNQVCIMVVDAAKSSEMKSLADPLAVEYSFREYQNLLEDLSKHLNGRVHSTAGDGAVVAFDSAAEAFTAAKRIQTDIERFNREDNRLQLPFRLRIGLHMGEIVGELDEVEFTEVIDIAAHVQAAAPVGGIAVTEKVAQHLPMEEFVPLAKQIDGQNVLLALNPTADKPWQTYST